MVEGGAVSNAIPEIALSIMQPWAWLIVNGFKDIENRNWRAANPGLRFRGPVAIHAGLKIDAEAHDDVVRGINPATGYRDMEGNLYPACFGNQVEVGGIVGVAEIVDVVTATESDWFFGPYGLVTANPRPVPFVPAKGALGFFRWTRKVETARVSEPSQETLEL